ncbi:MAG: hypothetical protein ACYDBJ_27965 [Aggregatilineales bacterium]
MFELTAEDQNLIDNIKERALDPKRRTQMTEKHSKKSYIYPSVSPQQVRDAEEVLGFRLPDLVREIYLQVGNGGFGPGYGIAGLGGGFKVYTGTLVEECQFFRAMKDPYPGFGWDNRGWDWKHHYIIYGYWGCTITTVVDCEFASLPVYSLDAETLKPHSSATLRQWWSDWLAGQVKQY